MAYNIRRLTSVLVANITQNINSITGSRLMSRRSPFAIL